MGWVELFGLGLLGCVGLGCVGRTGLVLGLLCWFGLVGLSQLLG